MPCTESGPRDTARSFSAPMTPADARKARAYMARYRAWERNCSDWIAFWHGGAPYWTGPRPKRPGPAPLPPTIANTACRALNQAARNAVYAELEAWLDQRYRCTGTCGPGHACQRRYRRSHGTGYSLEREVTYCILQVEATCECPGRRKEPRIEA